MSPTGIIQNVARTINLQRQTAGLLGAELLAMVSYGLFSVTFVPRLKSTLTSKERNLLFRLREGLK